MSTRIEHLAEGVILYLGDCREILPTLGKVDAVVTDPPYGQNYKVNTFYAGGSRESAVVQRNGKTLVVSPTIYDPIVGDAEAFDPAILLAAKADRFLIWGAHKFADRLPAGRLLIWDKVPTGKVRDQGDGEAAWVNDDKPLRIFRLLWDGLCVGVGARHEVTAGQKRLHPAQKPVALMRWCIEQIGRPRLILDPYMGVGSTGVAARELGCDFTGIECVPSYFEIACRRIDAAARTPDMFTEKPKPIEQATLQLDPESPR